MSSQLDEGSDEVEEAAEQAPEVRFMPLEHMWCEEGRVDHTGRS